MGSSRRRGTAGAAPAAAAGPADGVLRAGVVAVPGPELRVRAGDGQAGGWPVSPAARGRTCWPGSWTRTGGSMPGAGRRWRPPNISSLSRGAGTSWVPTRCTCCSSMPRAPVAADGAAGVSCCGLRVISVDGSTTDVPDSPPNVAFFGRPSTAGRDGAFPQGAVGGRGRSPGPGAWAGAAGVRAVHHRGADAGPGPAALLRAGDAGAGRPQLLVLVPWPATCWPPARISCGGLRRASRSSRSRCCPTAPTWRKLKPPRKADGAAHRRAGHRVHRVHHRARRRRRDILRAVLPGHRSPRHRRAPGAGPRVLLPGPVGLRDRDRPPQDRHGARASPCCAGKGPRGRGPGDVGAVRCLPGHLPAHRRPAWTPRASPRAGSAFPHALAAATATVPRLSPPDQLGQAPRHVPAQDPHGPASTSATARTGPAPRKTKKAGDFPARKPGEPSVTTVTRRIEFHLLQPWHIT